MFLIKGENSMRNFEELLLEVPMFVMVEHINLKIDGDTHYGTPLTKEDFIGKFHELETLICTDDKKYWVLYEEQYPETIMYNEIFWCIPREEIDFTCDKEYGWIIWEESEEYKKALEVYNQTLDRYNQFESNFAFYVLYNKRADNDVFRFWQNLQAYVDVSDNDVSCDNKVCFITYLEEHWNAWFKSIMDETYKYMNCTNMVWESWEEC